MSSTSLGSIRRLACSAPVLIRVAALPARSLLFRTASDGHAQGCQHAPGLTSAALTGPAIAGKTPSGQGVGDRSQFTACGGFTVITASVKNVNLPDGTVLWVTLGGEPIGRITLSGGAGSIASWTRRFGTPRKRAMGIFTQPPIGNSTPPPILSGLFV